MEVAEEYDGLACHEQIDMVCDMLLDAEGTDSELYATAVMLLLLIRNRVRAMEEPER